MTDAISIEYFVTYCQHVCPQPVTIIDVGAKDGETTKHFAEAFPSARVIAVEGNPHNFNKYFPGREHRLFEAYPVALSDFSGKGVFFIKRDEGIGSLYNRGLEYGSGSELVRVQTLKDFCDEQDVHELSILKIDAEGCTYDILAGAGEILDTVEVLHIETEGTEFFAGQHLHNEVVRLLTKRRFVCVLNAKAYIKATAYNAAGMQYDTVWIQHHSTHAPS